MIEIDSKIIDAKDLLDRVMKSASEKNIPYQFYNENEQTKLVSTDLYQMKQILDSAVRNIQMMNATWIISEQPIVSSRRYVGKLIVFLKRVFRKLTRWLFQSYYQQQTNFNGAVTRALSDMLKVQEGLIETCERWENEGNERE